MTSLLQKAIDEHDVVAVSQRLEEYEATPKTFHYNEPATSGPPASPWGAPRASTCRTWTSDSAGCRPERVRSGGNKFDGMVYFYLVCGGEGGIHVELALQPEPMQDADLSLLHAPS